MDEGLATVHSRAPEENGDWASLHDIIASIYCPSRFRTSNYLSSQNSHLATTWFIWSCHYDDGEVEKFQKPQHQHNEEVLAVKPNQQSQSETSVTEKFL